MNLEDSAGNVVSGSVPAALQHLEMAQHQLRCFIGDPVASVHAALEASPEMAMGHLLHAYLHLLGTEPDGIAVARESHRRALDLPMTERERSHLAAVGHLVCGRWGDAGRTLEDLSIQHPLDALALQAGHPIDFFCGDSRMLHDRIARALPHWGEGTPGFHAVLGMMAFGLEETGRYGRAEALGRRCIEIPPLADRWAPLATAANDAFNDMHAMMAFVGARRTPVPRPCSKPRARPPSAMTTTRASRSRWARRPRVRSRPSPKAGMSRSSSCCGRCETWRTASVAALRSGT